LRRGRRSFRLDFPLCWRCGANAKFSGPQWLLAVHMHELRGGIAVAGSGTGRECIRKRGQVGGRQVHLERAERFRQAVAPAVGTITDNISNGMSTSCRITNFITCIYRLHVGPPTGGRLTQYNKLYMQIYRCGAAVKPVLRI